MKIKCPNCNAAYDMDESRVPSGGLNIKCPRCKNPFRVAKPGTEATGPAPAPAESTPQGPVPLPAPARAPMPGRPPGAAPPIGPPPGVARAPVGPPRPAAAPAPIAPPPPEPTPLNLATAEPPGWAATAHPASQMAGAPSLSPPSENDPQNVPTVFGGTNPFSAAVAAVTSRPERQAEPEPTSFEVEEPPPEPPPAPAAGDMDLDLPPPDAAPAQGGPAGFNLADTDFASPPSMDPGLEAAASAAASENPFQLDIGTPPAPAASPAPAAHDLSMLDFDDGANAGGPQRWHVKRRSGKTFGPFDAPTIVAMLQQGQLLGNEDVSTDGQHWSPIGDEPDFVGAIKTALPPEQPKHEPPGMAAPQSAPRIAAPVMTAAAPPAPTPLETTGGPKAAVAKPRVPVWARLVVRRLPLLAGVAAAIAVIGGGLALGKFTSYGYFGMNLLTGKSGGASHLDPKSVETFNTAINEGTFPGLQKALATAQGQVTAAPGSPEAAMNLALASSRLVRRYGTPRTELDRAKTLLEKKDAAKTTESKIGLAAVKLADSKEAEAHALLAPLAKDRRAELLYAEELIASKKYKEAAAHLDAVLAARASGEAAMLKAEAAHGLADEAQERAALEAVMKAVPNHARARLWQARLEVAANKPDEAVKILTPLLAAPDVKNLETSEEAIGHHLLGDIYLARRQVTEAAQEYTKAADGDPSNPDHRIAAAQILLRRHQWQEAVAAYDKALEKSPKNIGLLIGSARALIETQSYQKANSRVEDAKKLAPTDPAVAVISGDLQVALQHLPDAHKAYAEALKLDEKYVPALIAEANLYLQQLKYEEAQKLIEKAVQLNPNDAAAQAASGQYYLAMQKPQEAKDAFNAALKLDEDRADSVAGLARALDALNEDAAAGDAYKKSVTLDPRNIPYREHYAEFLRKTGNLDAALVQLKAGLEVDQKDARLQALTGGVLLDLEQASEAEAALTKAIQLQDNDPFAHAYYGRLLSSFKADTQQAVEHLKRAVAAMPKSSDMHYQLGVVYERGQLLGDAVESFKQAVSLDDKNIDARHELGLVLVQQGQFTSGTDQLNKVLAADAKRQGIYGDLADAQFKAGDLDAAIKNLKAALEHPPKEGAKNAIGNPICSGGCLQYRLGRAYDRKGLATEATAAYEAAAAANPGMAAPWYYLGYAYKNRGKNKEAVRAFENYLQRARGAKKPKPGEPVNAEEAEVLKDAEQINDEIAFLKEAK